MGVRRKTDNLPIVAVTLVGCRHTVETLEQSKWTDTVLCPACSTRNKQAYRYVIEVHKSTTVRCRHPECSFRYSGSNESRALKMMYAHSGKNPSHIVQTWQRGKLIGTATLVKSQAELPLFELPPPF